MQVHSSSGMHTYVCLTFGNKLNLIELVMNRAKSRVLPENVFSFVC